MTRAALSLMAGLLFAGLAMAQEPQGATPAPTDPPCCCFAEETGGATPLWARADYLLWWIKAGPRGPLVTTGPAEGGGTLGEPGTRIIFGDSDFDFGGRSGVRLTLGGWCDPCQTLGFQSSAFVLEKNSVGFTARSDAGGNPTVSLPVTVVNDGSQNGYFLGIPDLRAGGVAISSGSRLWGWETNAVTSLGSGCTWNAQMLAGFRTLGLSEGLLIHGFRTPLVEEEIRFIDGFLSPGDVLQQADSFQTRNHFYGGQLGGQVQFLRGKMSLDLAGKVALGSTHQTVSVAGSTNLIPVTGPSSQFPVGYFALRSNIGASHEDQFTVVPEGNIRIGYQLTCSLKATLGYTFLYWSSVARPGDQFNRAVDITQAPSFGGNPAVLGTSPLPPFNHTDFWAQGLDLGLEYRF